MQAPLVKSGIYLFMIRKQKSLPASFSTSELGSFQVWLGSEEVKKCVFWIWIVKFNPGTVDEKFKC